MAHYFVRFLYGQFEAGMNTQRAEGICTLYQTARMPTLENLIMGWEDQILRKLKRLERILIYTKAVGDLE